MTDSFPSGFVAVVIIAIFLFFFGVWAGVYPFQLDTFKCTNVCAGAHSIQFGDKCYCEKTP